LMESIVITAPAGRVSWVQIVSTRSTSVIRSLVVTELPAMTKVEVTTRATVLTVTRENSARSTWTGAHKSPVTMMACVCNGKTFTLVTADLVGPESCVTLKWFHVKTLPFERRSIQKPSATMELAKISATRIDVTVSKAILVHTARKRSTSATHNPVKMGALVKI